MPERTGAFERLCERSLDPVLLARPDGTLLHANPAACRALGRSADDIRREGCTGLVLEEHRLRDLLADSARSGSAAAELTVRRSDGSTFPAAFTAGLIPSDDGAPVCYVIVDHSADHAPRDREYLFAAAQRAAHVGTWSWRIGDTTIDWSDETYRLYGLSPDLGSPDFESFFQIVHPDDRRELRAWAEAAAAGSSPPAVEFRALRPDGSCRTIRTEGDVIETVDGVPTRIAGTAYDVTDHLRASEALRESERRYRELFEMSPVALFLSEVICDAEGRPIDCRFLYVNQAFERFVGAKAADLVGRTLFEFNPQTSRDMMERQGRVALTGVPDGWEGYSVALDIHYQATVFSPRHGQSVTYLVDISERKRAEVALSEALDRERQAVRAGNVGLWDWDLHSNRVRYSPEWKHQIGFADDEISDDFEEWRTRVHPDDLDRCLTAVQAFLANPGLKYEVEFRFRHRNGSYRHILAHASVVRDAQGRPKRMLGSHVDVTERTELQAQFLQAQKMESIGRLAGGVAHDFNNLLTVINGTAELALEGLRERDPLRDDLQAIHEAGHRAALLTRQLLAISRKQVLQPTILDLNVVIADMQNMLTRLIGEDVALVFTLMNEPGRVSADPGQIEQVLLNLVVNAHDAMPDGGTITIATAHVNLDENYAELRPAVAAGPYVMVSVSDTGVGMDRETQARIFEPFFTTKGAGKGTGLGLSTVYGIVTQSGGHVGVYSEAGNGSSFRIYLPRVEAEAEPDRPIESRVVVRGSETILLVEDDEALRRLAERALASAGYTVLAAANGGEALLLLERFDGPVHLLLTDVIMPEMNGRDLASRLRETRHDFPVLFSSGYTDDIILHHGVLDDLTNFISKPYSVAALTRKVSEVLRSGRT
ncbi:MAG TPA: PAS domain-containing protein [Vicinamibacterales bacterium]|nr:PAS domain-containing protein [Vicinamibacterales bacterium]